MGITMERLLESERAGRMIVSLKPPQKGGEWRADVGKGDGAVLAAARWADRYGAKVLVRLSPDAPDDPICRVLAEPLRRLGCIYADTTGGKRSETPFRHDPDAAWSMPVAGVGRLFVRPASDAEAVLSVEETRETDRRSIEGFALPGLCLMENAAVGAAMAIFDLLGDGGWRTLVVAGGGNNAGDGLAVARGLVDRGMAVTAALLKDPSRLSPDAAENFRLLRARPECRIVDMSASTEALADELKRSDVVVDALLGTGFSGALSGPLMAVVEAVNRAGKTVVAMDLPSGMSGNDGVIGPAMRATRTITFGNLKPGLLGAGARDLTGDVFVAEIGAPGPVLNLEAFLHLREFLPKSTNCGNRP
ncbi:MAG: NAD(P)H-hydrate epimerase [Planctomycetota bacterium]|nr:NAD(P)H-hydrate epimerase [Planctomycetota bacterium]